MSTNISIHNKSITKATPNKRKTKNYGNQIAYNFKTDSGFQQAVPRSKTWCQMTIDRT